LSFSQRRKGAKAQIDDKQFHSGFAIDQYDQLPRFAFAGRLTGKFYFFRMIKT
jgi:hypothetical protein